MRDYRTAFVTRTAAPIEWIEQYTKVINAIPNISRVATFGATILSGRSKNLNAKARIVMNAINDNQVALRCLLSPLIWTGLRCCTPRIATNIVKIERYRAGRKERTKNVCSITSSF